MPKRIGLCCKSFPLPLTPEELDTIYNNTLREMGLSDIYGWVPAMQWDDGTMGGWKCSRRVEDIIEWWPWLRYLGEMKDNPFNGHKYSQPLSVYTCTKHDPVSGDCTAYDKRPHFCRSYGSFEVPCEFPSSECECGVYHMGEEKHEEARRKKEKEIEECRKEIEKLSVDEPVMIQV